MKRAAVAEKCAWAAVWQLQIKPPLCGSQGSDPTLSWPYLLLHLLKHFLEPDSNPDRFVYHRFFKIRIKIRCNPADKTPDSFQMSLQGKRETQGKEEFFPLFGHFSTLILLQPSPIPPSTQSHAVENEGFNLVNLIWHRRISAQDLSLTARPS